jgi:proliferating cell nuclear antigen
MATTQSTPAEPARATVDADRLRTVVGMAAALVDECTLELGPDGLHLPAVDPASVALVDVELASDAFQTYEARGTRFGVDLDRLHDVLGMADRDQTVTLAFDPDRRKLDLSLGDIDYALACIDPDAIRSPPDRSEMDPGYETRVVVDGDAVSRGLQAAGMVSDRVTFAVDPNAETFALAADGDTDDVSLALDAADCREFAPADARSMYSLDYLAAVEGALGTDGVVECQFGTETPVRLASEFADGAGSVEYLVSPRRTADY